MRNKMILVLAYASRLMSHLLIPKPCLRFWFSFLASWWLLLPYIIGCAFSGSKLLTIHDVIIVDQNKVMEVNRTDKKTRKKTHTVTCHKNLKVVDIIAETQADRVDNLQEEEKWSALTKTISIANLAVAHKAIWWVMKTIYQRTSFRFYPMKITPEATPKVLSTEWGQRKLIRIWDL